MVARAIQHISYAEGCFAWPRLYYYHIFRIMRSRVCLLFHVRHPLWYGPSDATGGRDASSRLIIHCSTRAFSYAVRRDRWKVHAVQRRAAMEIVLDVIFATIKKRITITMSLENWTIIIVKSLDNCAWFILRYILSVGVGIKKYKIAKSLFKHLPKYTDVMPHRRKRKGYNFRIAEPRMMASGAGMTCRIVPLFNARVKVRGRISKLLASPFVPSRTVCEIYLCVRVDSGKLWSIRKQISNSIETACYKHYSVCSGILAANPHILSSRAPPNVSSPHRPFLREYDFRVLLRVR